MERHLESVQRRWRSHAIPPDADQQPATQWPGAEWLVSTPEAEGVDPAAVDSLLADIDAGRYGLIDHFLLVRHGRVIADRSWDHAAPYVALLAAHEDTANHQYNYDHPAWHDQVVHDVTVKCVVATQLTPAARPPLRSAPPCTPRRRTDDCATLRSPLGRCRARPEAASPERPWETSGR